MGEFVKAISKTGGVVCYALNSTDIVDRAESIHQTSAVVTAGLGRLLTAASMMGLMLKNDTDSLTLRVSGDGPVGALIAVAQADGSVKGYVTNPVVELPLNQFGKLDVSGAVGKHGQLFVIKDLGLKEPYMGLVPLVSGEIAEDITHYFATSEQTPTVCSLGVLVNPNLTVQAAGGFIVQLLPGAAEEEITAIENNVSSIPPVSRLIAENTPVTRLAELVLAGLEPQVIDQRQIVYRCDCSRERVERALLSLGATELTAIAEEDKKAEVCCHFCNKKYRFSEQELRGLLSQKNS